MSVFVFAFHVPFDDAVTRAASGALPDTVEVGPTPMITMAALARDPSTASMV